MLHFQCIMLPTPTLAQMVHSDFILAINDVKVAAARQNLKGKGDGWVTSGCAPCICFMNGIDMLLDSCW